MSETSFDPVKHESKAVHPGGAGGNECEEKEHIQIFVNNRRFDETGGVKSKMTEVEIANLVGISGDVAVVRKEVGQSGKYSEPLSGTIDVETGDRFYVTRKAVNGGSGDNNRIERELDLLKEGGLEVEYLQAPENAVIYRNLPVLGAPELGPVDVLVRIPAGYSASMLDYAALPAGSPLIGKVKGAAQGTFFSNGRTWQTISYHPHAGGGAPPWNPHVHGLHTYVDELLSWLGEAK